MTHSSKARLTKLMAICRGYLLTAFEPSYRVSTFTATSDQTFSMVIVYEEQKDDSESEDSLEKFRQTRWK